MPETRTENADLAAAFHEFMARAAAERLAYNTGLLEGRLPVTARTASPSSACQVDRCPRVTILTTQTNLIRESALSTWKVAEAKARFSELIEKALAEGPQEVTRHGKQTVVVVSAAEWGRRTHRKDTLVEFLERSPLRGSALQIDRLDERPADVEL